MVINAVRRHIHSNKLAATLRLCSTGGRQAALIDGQTCAKLQSQSKYKSRGKDDKLKSEWQNVLCLVWDEISLASGQQMLSMSKAVNTGKSLGPESRGPGVAVSTRQTPVLRRAPEPTSSLGIFDAAPRKDGRPSIRTEPRRIRFMGGIDIVIVGDFYQFPSVGGRPLYKYSKARDTLSGQRFVEHVEKDLRKEHPKWGEDKVKTERDAVVEAVVAFRTFDDVIILTEQKRCVDSVYHEFLERLRYGYSREKRGYRNKNLLATIKKDYKMLQTLQLGHQTCIHKDPRRHCVVSTLPRRASRKAPLGPRGPTASSSRLETRRVSKSTTTGSWTLRAGRTASSCAV